MVNLSIAAITWHNDGLHVRVYFQKDDGFVYEAAWDKGIGWNSGDKKLFQAKIGTPLAAIVFVPTEPKIRVYYLDTSYMLQEYVFSSGWGWKKGATLPSPDLTPITSLAAVTWRQPPNQQIRVYYQKQNSTIQEVVYSSGWSVGFSFNDHAYPGTSLSAAIIKENVINYNPSFRVYWQEHKLSLNEYAWSGSWSNRDLHFSPTPSSGISAVAWLDGSGHAHIRIYLGNAAGNVQQLAYDDPNGWVIPPFIPVNVTVASFKAPVGAIAWQDEGIEVRIYVQSTSSNNITELVHSKGWSFRILNF
ncbi:hypothetical protein BDN72DRAFT_467893 [Pluteus cervinus]|uniref:Uncharacterized protein n=1 Tax=Pluteus cervinus TaxID=181527 RepID=A0ACD3AZK4_9AGAR|nr:hypothetical protein BDN72DRAFT_467893 [Pluteus cervinus]